MQKKLIALAVAGLVSGGAFAQSNVTIYGIVDVGVESGNSGYGSKLRVQSGQSAGNRIGFRGEENLGNGITAFFNLEQGFLLDNGQGSSNGSLTQGSGAASAGGATFASGNSGMNVAQTNSGSYVFNRLAIAGIKGSFGTVQIGRQYSPTFAVRAAVDTSALGTAASMATSNPGTVDRLDNAVMYMSPNMSGFMVGVGYTSGTENNTNANVFGAACSNAATAAAGDLCNDKSGRGWGLLGTYANGPVYVGLAHHRVRTAATPAAAVALGGGDVPDARQWQLGATYDFGVAKLAGLWGSHKVTISGMVHPFNGDLANDARGWALGVSVPMGAHKFIVNLGAQNDKLVADKDFKFYGVGYEYAMSKRTNLYAAYARVNNDDRAAGGGAGTVAGSALATGLMVTNPIAAGGSLGNYDPSALQFGMKHSF